MKCSVKFALPLLVLGTVPAVASEITLTSLNSDNVIHGDYVAYQDGAYIVRVAEQVFSVDAALVTCEGSDCAQEPQ